MPIPAHVKPLLKGIGLDDATIATIDAVPDDKAAEWKPDDILKTITTGYQTRLRNDPEFLGSISEDVLPPTILKSIESKQYGRAANIVRTNILKAFNLTDADFADLGEDGKKIEVFSKRAAEKYMAGKSSDKELQQQLIDARKELDTLKEAEPVKLKELEDKYKLDSESKMLDFIILASVAGVKNLKVPAAYVSDKVKQKLSSLYAFVIEGMDAKIKQKNNPALDVVNGSEILTLQKAIEKILAEDDLLTKEKKDEPPVTGTIKVEGTAEGLKVSGHIADKINNNLKIEQKAATV